MSTDAPLCSECDRELLAHTMGELRSCHARRDARIRMELRTLGIEQQRRVLESKLRLPDFLRKDRP